MCQALPTSRRHYQQAREDPEAKKDPVRFTKRRPNVEEIGLKWKIDSDVYAPYELFYVRMNCPY